MNRSTTLVGTAAALLLSLAGCGGATGAAAIDKVSSPTPPFLAAIQDCGLVGDGTVKIGDGGHSLLIDGEGDDGTGGASINEIACVLTKFGVSDAVVSQMDTTTALQGRQSATWGIYAASWTYHPDNGLDIIIEN